MVTKHVRQAVRTAYVFTCGYCGISETEVGAELTLDHYVPRASGGDDVFDNLVYCCHACNEFKGQTWDANAPPVLHPLRDVFASHFSENLDGSLAPITDAGRRHIETLHLNRPPLTKRRANNQSTRNLLQSQKALLQEQVETQTRLRALEKAVRDLTKRGTGSKNKKRK